MGDGLSVFMASPYFLSFVCLCLSQHTSPLLSAFMLSLQK